MFILFTTATADQTSVHGSQICFHFPIFQEKKNGQVEEYCSSSGSNYESWGRCSSPGAVRNEKSSSSDCTSDAYSRHQVQHLTSAVPSSVNVHFTKSKKVVQAVLRAIATPLRKFQGKSDSQTNKPKGSSASKLVESLTQRLWSCILKHTRYRKHLSS